MAIAAWPVICLAALCWSCASAYQWESVPRSVNDLKQNLTVDFEDNTALFWGTATSVVGGTGTLLKTLTGCACALRADFGG